MRRIGADPCRGNVRSAIENGAPRLVSGNLASSTRAKSSVPATSGWHEGSFSMAGCSLRKSSGFEAGFRAKCGITKRAGRLLAGALVLTQLCGTSLAAKKNPPPSTVTVKLPAPPKMKQVQGDQRVLQALDRLTFGPRPGELEEVKAIGLDAWIAQQLHPATIDDFAMEERLAKFPAMRLSEEDLTKKFPPGSVIRQVENGKISIPLFNNTERAIYENQVVADKKKQEQDKAKAKEETPVAAINQSVAPPPPPVLSDTEIAALLSLAPGSRMAKLVSLPAGEYAPLRKQLSPAQRAALEDGMSPDQREILVALDNPRQVVQNELLQSRVLRDIYSQRQLQEVMTDFWLNHFNIFQGKTGEEIYSLVPYERDVIRPNALGSFEVLLVETATSTAMMTYLDNAGSTGPHSYSANGGPPRPFAPPVPPKGGNPRGLNENYARELMELHTLGVNGGYTQRDVTEVARVFTGWTIEQPPKGGPRFVFDQSRHEPGTKHVLGVEIKENGYKEGLEVLHLLATSPATAHFICRKLAVRFVSDDPPQSLVDRLSTVFLASNGNIGEVMRFLVQAPEFWSVPAYRAKIKTPEDFVISAVRAGAIDVEDANVIVKAISDLGQPLYGRQTPDGYSMLSSPWVNSAALLERMNFSLSLAANRLSKGVIADWLGQLGATSLQQPEEQERQIETLLLHGQISDKTRALILQQLASAPLPPPQNNAKPIAMAGMGNGEVAGGVPPPKPSTSGQPMTPAQEHQAADRQAALTAGLLFGSPDFQRR
jgi:uncharacterized protein (DUF1800 family)